MKLTAAFAIIVLGACGGGVDDEGIGGDCTRHCQAIVAADCANGPRSTQCVSGCQNDAEGDCLEELVDFLACSDGEEVTCDPTNETPVVEACDPELAALDLCING